MAIVDPCNHCATNGEPIDVGQVGNLRGGWLPPPGRGWAAGYPLGRADCQSAAGCQPAPQALPGSQRVRKAMACPTHRCPELVRPSHYRTLARGANVVLTACRTVT